MSESGLEMPRHAVGGRNKLPVPFSGPARLETATASPAR